MHKKIDDLQVNIYATREEMGAAAAQCGAELIRDMLQREKTLNIMFAAAPSQNEVLAGLLAAPGIDWSRVNAFQMDDYVDFPADSGHRFSNFLRERLFDKLTFGNIFLMGTGSMQEEADSYSELLARYPLDICFTGIGENGHIAFNDPQEADFNDPLRVKIVNLDDACRAQQVNDGSFASIELVPAQAVTVTIPALMSAKEVICTVPGATKAAAVSRMLSGDISIDCPATIMRRHKRARLFLDAAAAQLIAL